MSYFISDQCTGCTACVKACPTGAISGEKKARHAIDPARCIECGACGRLCPRGGVLDDKGNVIARLKKSEWPRPVIIAEKCYACENCVNACPAGALSMADEHLPLANNHAVLAYPDRCVSCAWCVANCLFDAITMEAPE